MTAADQTPAKRCGECRLGLGVHTPSDPYCDLYRAPAADSERDERLRGIQERVDHHSPEEFGSETVGWLLALLAEQAATIERVAREAWNAGVEAAFESLDGYLASDFEAVLAKNPRALGSQRTEGQG